MKRFYLLDQELKPAGELLYIDAEEAPKGYAGFVEFLEAKAKESKKGPESKAKTQNKGK